MADVIRVKLQGVRKLKTALSKAARGMEAGAEAGQLEAAQAVADDWASNVPVDTGEYQRSIGADADGAFATARHAPFVEFGTSTHPAQPAGAAAAESGRRTVPDQISRAVRRRL